MIKRTSYGMLIVALVLGALGTTAVRASERHEGNLSPEAAGLEISLIEAIESRSKDALEEALDDGADPSSVAVIGHGRWALCAAARERDPHFLNRLLEAGADPNSYSPNRSIYSETALACALSSGNDEAVRTLDAWGADDSTVMCPDCLKSGTPFSMALSATNWFALEIMERRSLTPMELEDLRQDLRLSYFGDETYEGMPMREYLEGYLKERGIDPLPQLRKDSK